MGKKGLGAKGINVLFGEENVEKSKHIKCNVANIVPNKHQPRTQFNDAELQNLANSIKEQGVIQPLIVIEEGIDKYMLVAGERRLRAAKVAGLNEVPIVIFDVKKESDLLELALIENIQRTDLNAIEEAKAYQNLIKNFGYTQNQVAAKVGKKRSTIANSVRLLKLPKELQNDLVKGILSEGHGRVLIKFISSPLKIEQLRKKIVKNNLSVRQTEKAAKYMERQPSEKKQKNNFLPESYIKTIKKKLTTKLHSQISIDQKAGKGKIKITYQSADDLERIISLLLSENK